MQVVFFQRRPLKNKVRNDVFDYLVYHLKQSTEKHAKALWIPDEALGILMGKLDQNIFLCESHKDVI